MKPDRNKSAGFFDIRKCSVYVGFADESAIIAKTRTGKPNTATNLEHRMATIFRNAGLSDLKGGLHIFRRTFAAGMYENGARVKEIAAYIGDLESTTERYYSAVRKKIVEGGEMKQENKNKQKNKPFVMPRGKTYIRRLINLD